MIGGGLGVRLGEPFVQRIRKAMQPHLFNDTNPPDVLPAALGDLGGALGAALLVKPAARAAGAPSAGCHERRRLRWRGRSGRVGRHLTKTCQTGTRRRFGHSSPAWLSGRAGGGAGLDALPCTRELALRASVNPA